MACHFTGEVFSLSPGKFYEVSYIMGEIGFFFAGPLVAVIGDHYDALE